MLSLRYNRSYGQIRLPYRPGETSFPCIHRLLPVLHRDGSPVFIVVWLLLRVTSVTPEVHLSVKVVIVKRGAGGLPLSWTGSTTPFSSIEATSEFAHAATRRFAQLPCRAFVRKLSALDCPSHLPLATWVNYRNPMAELQPASHTFYTAYPRSQRFRRLFPTVYSY